MASCWDPTIQVHCIVLGVILSSGHKHADLFPALPKGRNHLPSQIWKCLIFHIPLLRNRNNCWLEMSGSDAGVGFCRAPLPPLGGIMTSPGAQHPFGAFSNRTICTGPIPFVEERYLRQVLIRKWQGQNQRKRFLLYVSNLLRGSCYVASALERVVLKEWGPLMARQGFGE